MPIFLRPHRGYLVPLLPVYGATRSPLLTLAITGIRRSGYAESLALPHDAAMNVVPAPAMSSTAAYAGSAGDRQRIPTTMGA